MFICKIRYGLHNLFQTGPKKGPKCKTIFLGMALIEWDQSGNPGTTVLGSKPHFGYRPYYARALKQAEQNRKETKDRNERKNSNLNSQLPCVS